MNFSIGLNELFSIGALLVAALSWLYRSKANSDTTDATLKAELKAHSIEIRDLKAELKAVSEGHQMIARLEERTNAMAKQLEQLPVTIGNAVGEGIRSALNAVLAGASAKKVA